MKSAAAIDTKAFSTFRNLPIMKSSSCKRRGSRFMAVACCGFNNETQSFSWNAQLATSYLHSLGNDRLSTRLHMLHHECSAKARSHPRHQSILFAQKCESDVTTRTTSRAKKRQSRKRKIMSTFSTAVCIVPPDEAWDSIQRARHLARDTSFYKWPPAIRLFHPFAPKSEIPSQVGKLAEWIDQEGLRFDMTSDSDDLPDDLFPFVTPFEVTLDSLQILPHWEVLDARVDMATSLTPQQGLGETFEERRFREQKEESAMLIENEAQKGIIRKKERVKKDLIDRRRKLKRDLKQRKKEIEMGIVDAHLDDIKQQLEDVQTEIDRVTALEDLEESADKLEDETPHSTESNRFEGPCVIYLSPNEQSCLALKTLRDELCTKLFPEYDLYSPSSSVSSYPEFLPRKSLSESWRPLLPIARFSSVKEAIKIAKVLQKSWDPLEFTVTDIQFISRNEEDFANHNNPNSNFEPGSGFGKKSYTTQSIAVTTSSEVEDVSQRGVYGCDAMVMLLGEEPEEELMEDDATLSMIVSKDEIESTVMNGDSIEGSRMSQEGSIDYNALFTDAEREYQRMASHEELSAAEFLGQIPIFSGDEDLEKWLDTEDGETDEGATAVLGRAQFFMGAMREFVGMPVSSFIDAKDRIMGDGINSLARKKGSKNVLDDSGDVSIEESNSD